MFIVYKNVYCIKVLFIVYKNMYVLKIILLSIKNILREKKFSNSL